MESEAKAFERAGSDAAAHDAAQPMDLAGKWRRLATVLADYVGFFLFAVVFGLTLGIVLGDDAEPLLAKVPDSVFGLSIYVAYYLFFEGIWARTPGKLLLGTQVVNLSGGKPSFGQVLGRTFSRFIPFEMFSFLFDTPGWHDSIPKTRVVRVRRA